MRVGIGRLAKKNYCWIDIVRASGKWRDPRFGSIRDNAQTEQNKRLQVQLLTLYLPDSYRYNLFNKSVD